MKSESPSQPRVVGVTGYPGAGKDKFAGMLVAQLEQQGQKVMMVSSGDLIRAYVSDNNLGDPGDRGLLQHVAGTKPQTYWLEVAIKRAAGHDVLVYPGLRQSIEADYIHEHHGLIIGIEVSDELRYERSLLRSRPGDEKSFERFKAETEAERNGKAQQIDEVLAVSDITIANDGTLEQLDKVVAKVAAGLNQEPIKHYQASQF